MRGFSRNRVWFSKNPNTIFTVLSQLPDFILFIMVGNIANKVKGKANPKAKPSMETKKTKLLLEPDAISIKAAPNIGPVQEKETNTVVKAMKNEPR